MRIRFDAVRDVFTAYPTLAEDVLAAPRDDAPLAYFEMLIASETPEDAISFFAYFAPKREAVWWGCRCIEALALPVRFAEAYGAAALWVREPEEEHRRAALAVAEGSDACAPETWAAYGAGWAGGNIAPEGLPPVAAAPHLTAKAVRATVLIALAEGPAAQRRDRLRVCYREAMKVAGDDID